MNISTAFTNQAAGLTKQGKYDTGIHIHWGKYGILTSTLSGIPQLQNGGASPSLDGTPLCNGIDRRSIMSCPLLHQLQQCAFVQTGTPFHFTKMTEDMQAIVFDTFGAPNVLKVVRYPKPVPRTGEVLVKIHAAGGVCWFFCC